MRLLAVAIMWVFPPEFVRLNLRASEGMLCVQDMLRQRIASRIA